MSPEARSLGDEATCAFKRGDIGACAEIAVRGTRLSEQKGDETEAWWFRRLTAQCYGLLGRFEEALVCVRERGNSLNPRLRAQLMVQRSFYQTQVGDYASAKATLDQAEAIVNDLTEWPILAEVQLAKTNFYFYLADHESMEASARRALSLAAENNSAITEAWAASGIGKSFMLRYRFHEAIESYERAAEIFVREGQRFHVAQMQSELGCCHLGLGNDQTALECFSKALNCCSDAKAVPGYQINLANIGNVHLRRREFSAAISHYQEALNIACQLGDTISAAKWLRNLSLTYSEMGNLSLAGAFQKEASKAEEKTNRARALAAK